MKKRTLLTLLWGLCCFLLLQQPITTQAQDRLRVNGTAVGIGGSLGGRSRQFTLIANSYTAPNQVRELNDALRRGGQDELLRVISGMNAGRITIGSGVGLTANVIIADRWGSGTKLTVFYERNVSFYEMRSGARSENYRVGYAELFLDSNGKGQGTFIPAARVKLKEDNTWEVEDFGVFPARLLGLRSSGSVQPR